MPTAELRRERGTTGVGMGGTVDQEDTVQEDDGDGDSGFSARTTSGSSSTVDVSTNYGVSPDGSSNDGSDSGDDPKPGWVENIPGAGEMFDFADAADAGSDAFQRFESGLEQTQDNFSNQIDGVSGSVSDLQSNVQERFSSVTDGFESLSGGLANTQSAVASLRSQVAQLAGAEDEDREEPAAGGGGIGTTTIAVGGAVAAAAVWFMTQN